MTQDLPDTHQFSANHLGDMGSGEGGQRERGRGRLGDANRKQKREDTFVSPAIKWLMFSFNMFFWVNNWYTRICFSVFTSNIFSH